MLPHSRHERCSWRLLMLVSIGSQPAGDLITNPTVGFRCFPTGLQLTSQPHSVTTFWSEWNQWNYTAWWQRVTEAHACGRPESLHKMARPGVEPVTTGSRIQRHNRATHYKNIKMSQIVSFQQRFEAHVQCFKCFLFHAEGPAFEKRTDAELCV